MWQHFCACSLKLAGQLHLKAIFDIAHGPLGADYVRMYDSMQDNINRQHYDCTLSCMLYY